MLDDIVAGEHVPHYLEVHKDEQNLEPIDIFGCYCRKRKLITSFGSLFGAWNDKYVVFDRTKHRLSYKKWETDPCPTHVPFFVALLDIRSSSR